MEQQQRAEELRGQLGRKEEELQAALVRCGAPASPGVTPGRPPGCEAWLSHSPACTRRPSELQCPLLLKAPSKSSKPTWLRMK